MSVRAILARLWAVLNGVLIVLVLAGWLARYVDPRTSLWWLQLVAIPLPYTGLALAASGIVALVSRRWALLAVHLVLLVLLGWRFAPRVSGVGEGAAAMLLSYNIGPQYGWQRDTTSAQLVRLAQARSPDVIALQEAWMGHQPDEAAPHIAMYYRALVDSLGYAVARADTIPAVRVSTEPILSTLPLRDLWHAQYDAYDAGAASGVTRTEVLHAGRPFVLYNIHLRTHGEVKPWHAGEPWDTDTTSTQWQRWKQFVAGMRDGYRARAFDTERLMSRLAEEVHPVVIAGDFNSTPHDWVYAQLKAGRRDAFAAVGDGWGSTYHARLPFARIDYVLADPELVVERADVLAPLLSDHRPLLVALRWRNDLPPPEPSASELFSEPAPRVGQQPTLAAPTAAAAVRVDSVDVVPDAAQPSPAAMPRNDEARH